MGSVEVEGEDCFLDEGCFDYFHVIVFDVEGDGGDVKVVVLGDVVVEFDFGFHCVGVCEHEMFEGC